MHEIFHFDPCVFYIFIDIYTVGPKKYEGPKKMYTHFNRGYLWIFSKMKRNVMHGM
jgi:hypothetical protein